MAVPKGPLGRQSQAFELEMKPQAVKLCAEVWLRTTWDPEQPVGLSFQGQLHRGATFCQLAAWALSRGPAFYNLVLL